MHDQTGLVLQGGGALGAYQAGVYEGMVEQGIAPNWVAGVSIGAINGALIAGNRADALTRRVEDYADPCQREAARVTHTPIGMTHHAFKP